VGERLDSWKDIAAYLGRDLRTVQRWESERRLPVHRLPGGDKPRVYALPSELDAWLRASPAEGREAASVAVLPFVNLTADKESEYFGDGLADEVINALTRIPGLRVTARTSSFAFRSKEQDVREIGTRLGVAALLEGSVRRQHNRVRVAAQLVGAADGFHLWSESYDRDLSDIFAIQDELARSIALALKVRLAPAPLVERMTDDLEAYGLWLKGRCLGMLYTPEAIAGARQCFEEAIARDPRFPLPYVALAQLLFEAAQFLLLPPAEVRRARQALLQALSLNDRLGEAYALLGTLDCFLEYDWASAERSFERAFEFSPGSSTVLARHAWYFLGPKLRIAEAVEELRHAVALDPLSPFLHSHLALALVVAREYDSAAEEGRAAVELAPALWWPHWMLLTALVFQGRGDEAVAEGRLAAEICGAPWVAAGMCVVYGLLGRAEEAQQCFARVLDSARTASVSPLSMAWAYMGVGDERVFEWLEKAIDARDPGVMYMPGLPIYDGIRGDPRFRALLAKMGLA
jgi:TolB-like protein/Tfp pilus assembly protein PilF